MAFIPGWVWHPLIMFVAIRLGWSLVRRFLAKDPAVWVAQKMRPKGSHRRRDAEVIRWGIITAAVGLIIAAQYTVQAAIAEWGPHEGGSATPAIAVTETRAFPRDPGKDFPFYVDVYLNIQGNRRVVNACQSAMLQATGTGDQPSALDAAFTWLRAGLDAGVPHKCNNWSPGQSPFITVFPTPVVQDADVAKMISGDKSIYVLVTWEYQFQDSPTIYIQEYCAFFNGTLGNVKLCSGPHNGAFVHIRK